MPTFKTKCYGETVIIDGDEFPFSQVRISQNDFNRIKEIVYLVQFCMKCASPFFFNPERSTVINPQYACKIQMIKLIRNFFYVPFSLKECKVLVEFAMEVLEDERRIKAKEEKNI
jgi:hypothetical protein